MTARDPQAEREHAEWTGWYDGERDTDEADASCEAFTAGMQAQRDLTAATGDGTLRTRITRLAKAWSAVHLLTEQGQQLRDLGQILHDELAYASDKPKPAPGTAPLDAAVLHAEVRKLSGALETIASGAQGSLDTAIPLDREWVVGRALSALGWAELPGTAPAFAAARPLDADFMAEIIAERDRLRELLDEIGVMAANAPEDGDSFGVLEEIAMRIAAFGTGG